MKPKMLILDEPAAGLDPKGRADVVKMIRDYRNSSGATVIISSHKMEDMAMLADRLIVMNDGKLLMLDDTKKVFSRPEVLRSAGLDVPIVTQVFEKIRSRGIDVPADIFTVEDAVEYLTFVKEGNGNA